MLFYSVLFFLSTTYFYPDTQTIQMLFVFQIGNYLVHEYNIYVQNPFTRNVGYNSSMAPPQAPLLAAHAEQQNKGQVVQVSQRRKVGNSA